MRSVLVNENASTSGEASTSASASWENVFPAAWIPVIERDMQKIAENRTGPATNTYSDAYINGMPAKKRKLLFSKNDLLTKNLFKRVLSRTLEKIQVKSATSTTNLSGEQIVDASLTQSRLIDSFDSEFDSAITERLRHDVDFREITKKAETKEKAENAEKNEDSPFYSEERFQNSRKRLNWIIYSGIILKRTYH